SALKHLPHRVLPEQKGGEPGFAWLDKPVGHVQSLVVRASLPLQIDRDKPPPAPIDRSRSGSMVRVAAHDGVRPIPRRTCIRKRNDPSRGLRAPPQALVREPQRSRHRWPPLTMLPFASRCLDLQSKCTLPSARHKRVRTWDPDEWLDRRN